MVMISPRADANSASAATVENGMRELNDDGRRVISQAAARHGFSEDAVSNALLALAAGGGSQAQFSHPELGGFGQWQRGGMIMIGDMFNQGLKASVAGLCADLSAALAASPLWKPERAPSGSDASFAYPAGSAWPTELGAPSTSGAQNDLAYAYFPSTRRLAIRRGGEVKIYDTGAHVISGVSQQQGGDQTLTFTSQLGLVPLADLPPVAATSPTSASAEPPAAAAAPELIPPARIAPEPPTAAPAPKLAPSAVLQPAAPTNEDIFAKLERLADLRQKGVLTEEEFARKKAELLDRI